MIMKTIEERAKLTAWEIFEEIGFPNHLVKRVSEIIEEKILEQKTIDNAEWLKIKSSWEREAQINHNDENNYKQGFHDAIEKACEWLKENIEGGVHPQSAYGFADRFKKALEE